MDRRFHKETISSKQDLAHNKTLKKKAYTQMGSIVMGPHEGAAKNSTPLREIDCPLGDTSERSFLLC